VDKMGEMSGMWEGIILSLLFVTLLTAVLGHFNTQYGQDYSVGLDDTGISQFTAATENAHGEVDGEVTQTSDGLTLRDTWTVGKNIYKTLTGFLNGNFIYTLIVDILILPKIVANILITLIWLSLILIIIYIFMKVIP